MKCARRALPDGQARLTGHVAVAEYDVAGVEAVAAASAVRPAGGTAVPICLRGRATGGVGALAVVAAVGVSTTLVCAATGTLVRAADDRCGGDEAGGISAAPHLPVFPDQAVADQLPLDEHAVHLQRDPIGSDDSEAAFLLATIPIDHDTRAGDGCDDVRVAINMPRSIEGNLPAGGSRPGHRRAAHDASVVHAGNVGSGQVGADTQIACGTVHGRLARVVADHDRPLLGHAGVERVGIERCVGCFRLEGTGVPGRIDDETISVGFLQLGFRQVGLSPVEAVHSGPKAEQARDEEQQKPPDETTQRGVRLNRERCNTER
mmetsp:Transcript_69705/g.202083  ORF Transcript_69705/g.202083 Transcript_69705/m.202083 type:complete len:319 (-) Transcript_69705:179-1135(-)